MVKYSLQRSHFWASLLLLLALLVAQPLEVDHIHLGDSQVERCDLCFNHIPAALGSEYQFQRPLLVAHYHDRQAPVPSDSQPERQSARAPPLPLSLS